MLKTIAAGLAVLTLAAAPVGATQNEALQTAPLMTPIPSDEIQVAWTCFFQGDQLSGMNRICYYDCAGSAAAITIGAAQLCPLTINR